MRDQVLRKKRRRERHETISLDEPPRTTGNGECGKEDKEEEEERGMVDGLASGEDVRKC